MKSLQWLVCFSLVCFVSFKETGKIVRNSDVVISWLCQLVAVGSTFCRDIRIVIVTRVHHVQPYFKPFKLVAGPKVHNIVAFILHGVFGIHIIASHFLPFSTKAETFCKKRLVPYLRVMNPVRCIVHFITRIAVSFLYKTYKLVL